MNLNKAKYLLIRETYNNPKLDTDNEYLTTYQL